MWAPEEDSWGRHPSAQQIHNHSSPRPARHRLSKGLTGRCNPDSPDSPRYLSPVDGADQGPVLPQGGGQLSPVLLVIVDSAKYWSPPGLAWLPVVSKCTGVDKQRWIFGYFLCLQRQGSTIGEQPRLARFDWHWSISSYGGLKLWYDDTILYNFGFMWLLLERYYLKLKL